MRLPQKRLGWLAVLLASFVRAVQIPFDTPTNHNRISDHRTSGWNVEGEWDFAQKPNPNATDHLIFDSVNTFLQQWTHTRYRNGHNIVPGVVPVGTLLYHGTGVPVIPQVPEWTATDPEHSFVFCRGQQSEDGCWHLTLVATRPLKVLYFDGSSAAKMIFGSMDSQDLLVWGEPRPDRVFNERKRINDLCDWGRKHKLDGFLRMEMDFEIMLCDFSSGTEVVSFVNLAHVNDGRRDVPQPPKYQSPHSWQGLLPSAHPKNSRLFSPSYRALEAGKWHDTFPGETRVQLDYSRILSFYDINLFPSLQVARFNQERWFHRLAEMSPRELSTIAGHADRILTQKTGSGVDWKTLYRVVYDRYFDRLDILRYMLNPPSPDGEADALTVAKKIQRQVKAMIIPYVLASAVPRRELDGPMPNHTWAAPIFKQCATTHVEFIDSPAFSQRLTTSEKLLLNAVKGVAKEICRVLVGIFAEGSERGILEGEPGSLTSSDEKSMAGLVSSWKTSVESLMRWLDWSAWQRCDPACGFEELCYLPTWPYFNEGAGKFPPREPPLRPTPRCIRRIEPFEI